MSIRPLHIICILLICSPLMFIWHSTSSNTQVAVIKFWNGNKTASRQLYEREVLDAVLRATEEKYGVIPLVEDKTDYANPEDEARIFRSKGFDVFGTVAGNPKLENEKKIVVPYPMMKGLLGYRLLIIRKDDEQKYQKISQPSQLQQERLGIPLGWADAALFRHNGYSVVEEGSFNDLFTRQLDKQFDYVSFGANEVESVYSSLASASGDLIIENSLLLYYPFPLVFYVNPNNEQLAHRIASGMKSITDNGVLDEIFIRHYGDLVSRLKLKDRRMIELANPLLSGSLENYQSPLLKN